jgi:deazaflavin-dependent oxidoreductase (nitroreductase family)
VTALKQDYHRAASATTAAQSPTKRIAMFLYLTTTGRRTGLPREIEIWFTERGGHFYVIAEHRDRANWVRNIRANLHVHVRAGDRRFAGTARLVDDEREPDLAEAVKALSDAKYGWSDGLIVEITPEN